MKEDNRGMTLVELMIAITMLAVITTPFLNSFIVSVRNNNKARNIFRATTVAQNLMEGLEAFTLEEICMQVNQEASKTKLYRPYGYKSHYEMDNGQGEKSGTVIDGIYEFSQTPSNQYRFAIQGIEEDGMFYDARILLDASGYRHVENEEDRWLYNENFSTEVKVMNENTDVIFFVTKEEEEKIFEEAGWDESQGLDNVERVFSVLVEQDSQNPESEKVSIKLQYRYQGSLVQGKTLDKTVNSLDNIYLMYYPNYSSVQTKIMDCFEVDLKQEEEFDLCIIKQKYDEPKTDDLYVASLDIQDACNTISGSDPRITLRTNVGKNLYDKNAGIRRDALQCQYTNNGVLDAIRAEQMMNYVDGMPQSLVGQTQKVNPIFKVVVQVFPEGTYDVAKPENFDVAEPLIQLAN